MDRVDCVNSNAKFLIYDGNDEEPHSLNEQDLGRVRQTLLIVPFQEVANQGSAHNCCQSVLRIRGLIVDSMTS